MRIGGVQAKRYGWRKFRRERMTPRTGICLYNGGQNSLCQSTGRLWFNLQSTRQRSTLKG